MYCVSLPGHTWQCGLKYTGINSQTLQDKDMISLIEINTHGSGSIVMGDRYVKSNETKKILYVNADKLYGHSTSKPLPFDEIKFEKIICFQKKQRIFYLLLKRKSFIKINILII